MSHRENDSQTPGDDRRLEELLAPMRDLPVPASLRGRLERRLDAELRGARAIPWYRRHLSIPLPAAAAAAVLLVAGAWLLLRPMGAPERPADRTGPGSSARSQGALAAASPRTEALKLQVAGFGDVMVTEIHDYRTQEDTR